MRKNVQNLQKLQISPPPLLIYQRYYYLKLQTTAPYAKTPTTAKLIHAKSIINVTPAKMDTGRLKNKPKYVLTFLLQNPTKHKNIKQINLVIANIIHCKKY